MAARRGKSQARRSGGNSGGLPGWAWLVLGVVLTIIVVMVAPKLLKGEGDAFLRPHANPDAQPTPVVVDNDELLPADETPATPKPGNAEAEPADGQARNPEYDFYTLLPGKEVPMTDAELAATERAEAERQARQRQQEAAAAPSASTAGATTVVTGTATVAPGATTATRTEPLPKPVSDGDAPTRAATPHPAGTDAAPGASTAKPTATGDDTRYLLQAGAFQASGQAEELKAKIAMLGLGARVEAAQIKGQTVYRVRMGPYGTASELAEAKRKLSAGGLTAMAIKVE
ncbi:SPOR domain-containing protein [Aerolutibacter ruishenii]|uniref:Cell division protein FtsN n=1 Tax=Aerolutibacter ruishenii TaxID=686800 RepID=A0A562M141_9GAMM|nr:SPOR domain-containing protein [Lysobacter ruishenii]TWI13629.1 cell division protein FtsN [Lysobacter ruishenii]